MYLMLLLLLTSSCNHALQEPPKTNQVAEYIEGLRSFDDNERQKAKANLLSLGSQSIAPLISLLDDLVRDDFTPWFATGREREGKEAWEKLPTMDLRDPRSKAFVDRLAKLEVSGRMRNDAIELLGQLHARKAVPLLIRIMEEREIDNAFEKLRLEMVALASIGSVAVPALIESIKHADSGAKRNRHGVPAYRIQVRSARVLGLIGDARALPVLKDLLRSTRDVIVWDAIEKIKRKNGIK